VRTFADEIQNVMKMKQIFMLLAAVLLTACSKDDEVKAATVQEAGKTLVVYYSYTNNCHEIVTSLTSQIQADVMRIEPADKAQKYEANGYAIGTALLNAIKAAPNDAASYPAIDPVSITDLSQYQNIIIVTPLWWSQMAAIMQTYLFNYGAQMAGKHVALIVSSHSSGISGVVADAERLVKNVTWMGDALWINANNHGNRASLIQDWLPTLNFAGKQITMSKMYITIDGQTQAVTLVDNQATKTLVEKLQQTPVTVTLSSSGGFEVWGSLGFSLPTSNEQINAQPGDVILYNGSNICIFYGTNSWSYTRLGKIDGLSESELRTFLKAGESNITVTLSLNNTTGISNVRSNSERGVFYTLNGQRVENPNKGIFIRNGKKVIL
jgi:flavodoxin